MRITKFYAISVNDFETYGCPLCGCGDYYNLSAMTDEDLNEESSRNSDLMICANDECKNSFVVINEGHDTTGISLRKKKESLDLSLGHYDEKEQAFFPKLSKHPRSE